MATIIQVKDLINGTNKEDWHHFTVTPKTKKQAEELRDAFRKLLRNKARGQLKKIKEYMNILWE